MKTTFNQFLLKGFRSGMTALFITLWLSTSYGQVMTKVTITAESLWRNQGYGVSNHTFDIDTYNSNNFMNYPCDPDPTTGACSSEYYTTSDLWLTTATNVAYNTLKIRPYCSQSATDYRNGLSSLDLVAMQGQINGTTLYSSRNPTDDVPYRFISSDADYNNLFQQADITMVQNLILGTRNDLTRPNWAWVHKDEVEVNSVDFYTYPDMYDYVIDYNWPGIDGIILANNTKPQITGDHDKYFTFRTTKVGDIVGTSGSGHNTWVCGTGTYLTSEEVESRSSSDLPSKKIMSGSTVKFKVDIQHDVDILSMEFFLNIDNKDFDVKNVSFTNNFTPRWYYNCDMGVLAISDFNLNLSSLEIESGTIMEIELYAKRDVLNLGSSVGWNKNRNIEISGMNETLINPNINLELVSIIPGNLYSEIRINNGSFVAYIESSKIEKANLRWYNNQGILISSSVVNLNQGENFFVANFLMPGIYFLQVQGENQLSIAKTINW